MHQQLAFLQFQHIPVFTTMRAGPAPENDRIVSPVKAGEFTAD